MDQLTKLKCPHCDAEYKIKWQDESIEPTTCPFCGAEVFDRRRRRCI